MSSMPHGMIPRQRNTALAEHGTDLLHGQLPKMIKFSQRVQCFDVAGHYN